MSLRNIIRLGLLNVCYEVGFSIKCRDPNGRRRAGLLGVFLFFFLLITSGTSVCGQRSIVSVAV